MQAFKVIIQPVDSGIMPQTSQNAIIPGDASYSMTPVGPVEINTPMTQAQIVGLQGYLVCIARGTNTGTVETAITALAPT